MAAMTAADYDVGWATQWDDMKEYGPFSRHLRRLLVSTIRPLAFTSVLDIGCGQGALLTTLRSEFPHIEPHGVDISPVAVELARKRVPDGRFWVLDTVKDRLNEKFDLVVCSEVIEHIPDDRQTLSNIAAMTGKYLVLSTVQGRIRRFESEQIGHIHAYAPGEVVQKIEASGFKVISVRQWGFPFYSPLYRNVLEFIDAKGTSGAFGTGRKVLSHLLYALFLFNSSKRGDEIIVLAEPRTVEC
jgi:SAM-dependent methyltransferase